jgi:hypothetical protein
VTPDDEAGSNRQDDGARPNQDFVDRSVVGNPVIALDRAVHQQVNSARAHLKTAMLPPIQSITANAQILTIARIDHFLRLHGATA